MTSSTLSKWGNSTAVRIPNPIIKQLNLKPGDSIEISLNDQNHIVIVPNVNMEPTNKELYNHLQQLITKMEKRTDRDEIIDFSVKGDGIL